MDDSFIAPPLTSYAGTCARQCFAPTSGNGLATVFAMLEPFARGNPRTCAANRVTYCVINLILHSAIARPSTGHISFHLFRRSDVGIQSVWFNASPPLRPRHRVKATANGGLIDRWFVSARRPQPQCPMLPVANALWACLSGFGHPTHRERQVLGKAAERLNNLNCGWKPTRTSPSTVRYAPLVCRPVFPAELTL